MIQLQDVLGLGSEARMNFPGTVGPQNWTWRMDPDALTPGSPPASRDQATASARPPTSRRGRPDLP